MQSNSFNFNKMLPLDILQKLQEPSTLLQYLNPYTDFRWVTEVTWKALLIVYESLMEQDLPLRSL